MEGHGVAVGGFVVGFQHVDFAVFGPVGWVGEPEGGPGGASVGRVGDVEDEEPVVVGFLGGDAHGFPAAGLVGGAGVDAQDGAGAGGVG